MADTPEEAAFIRRLHETHQRQKAQIKALAERYNKLMSERESDKMDLARLTKTLKKAMERIRYIEDIPGKRVPYTLNFSIDIPPPTTPATTVAGQRLQAVQPISMDGPFVCTTYMSAFLMKTFSIGPYGNQDSGRPNDPVAGTEVITPLSGRFRPVASSADPFAGAYVGYGLGPQTEAGALSVQTFRPGVIDFLFEVADEGVDRLRQNQISTPSRYLFSEFDRPFYLAVSDFFERGSSIKFTATLTRELGFAEVNYALLQNGFTEGDQSPPPDPTVTSPADIGRAVVSIGGTLYFSMHGYKILQAQSPAV